ncbi:MAG: type II toxin-antitoxin system PemK/MazF family toxin [Candidatus Hydrogenedentes bacterium]|nr:type II toxin-antitoxin system PemK/MazF family toxin [Candidatus Hydrogenedentota bacterium]
MSQGEIWWANLPVPKKSEPGFYRPVLIIQGDSLNRSKIATAMCVPLTSNLKWAQAMGNVLLTARSTGLPKDSVALAAQIITLDKTQLVERCGKLSAVKIEAVLSGIELVLGRYQQDI